MYIQKESFWKRNFSSKEAGHNISWGAIFAGLFTFVAMFMFLSLITSAVGLLLFKPTTSQPFDGVGMGTLITTVIVMLLSLFAGGFVAGLAARRAGMLHGFMTWALSLIVATVLVTSSVVGIIGTLGRAVGSTLNVVGKAVSATGDVAADAVNASFEQLTKQVKGVDTKELDANIKKVLKDTDVKELQPGYIRNLIEASKNDVIETAKTALLNPDQADQAFEGLTNKLKKRAEVLGNAVDKNAIANAVSKNTNLSKAEADKAVNNIHNGLKKASQEAQKQIDLLDQKVQEAKGQIAVTVENARKTAEKASRTAALSAIVLFIAQLIGLCLTAFAGYVGSKKTQDTIMQA